MDYIERMEQELGDLLERAEKLQRLMNTALELDRKDSNMMYAQLCLMEGYIEVLIKRIQYAKEKNLKWRV